MTEKFECIVKHLYRRQYQTAGGNWSTIYYARFTDWKGKRRMFPLGSDLISAREGLTLLEARNIRREDFDADKVKGVTFAAWARRYLDLMKHKKSIERDKRSCRRLEEFFGPMEISEITRARVMEFKNSRLADPIVRRGKIVAGRTIQISTVNRELACLKHMLRLAADEGIIESVPSIKIDSEKGFARHRVITDEEYRGLLEASPPYLRRILIGLCETAMRRTELLTLTWDRVDERAGVIRLLAENTKEAQKRIIPISPALSQVLAELRSERKLYRNIAGRVFTRRGKSIKSIRTAFELARKKAGISDIVLHDFRHTAITRWAAMGIPQEIAMKASGHQSLAMHYRYVNLQEQHVREAFSVATSWQHEKMASEKTVAGTGVAQKT